VLTAADAGLLVDTDGQAHELAGHGRFRS
jgi:hypothetical protein